MPWSGAASKILFQNIIQKCEEDISNIGCFFFFKSALSMRGAGILSSVLFCNLEPQSRPAILLSLTHQKSDIFIS